MAEHSVSRRPNKCSTFPCKSASCDHDATPIKIRRHSFQEEKHDFQNFVSLAFPDVWFLSAQMMMDFFPSITADDDSLDGPRFTFFSICWRKEYVFFFRIPGICNSAPWFMRSTWTWICVWPECALFYAFRNFIYSRFSNSPSTTKSWNKQKKQFWRARHPNSNERKINKFTFATMWRRNAWHRQHVGLACRLSAVVVVAVFVCIKLYVFSSNMCKSPLFSLPSISHCAKAKVGKTRTPIVRYARAVAMIQRCSLPNNKHTEESSAHKIARHA